MCRVFVMEEGKGMSHSSESLVLWGRQQHNQFVCVCVCVCVRGEERNLRCRDAQLIRDLNRLADFRHQKVFVTNIVISICYMTYLFMIWNKL